MAYCDLFDIHLTCHKFKKKWGELNVIAETQLQFQNHLLQEQVTASTKEISFEMNAKTKI